MASQWYKPLTPHGTTTRTITLELEVKTTATDSVDDLAHALIGDAVNALIGEHQVMCRVKTVNVDGKNIYDQAKLTRRPPERKRA